MSFQDDVQFCYEEWCNVKGGAIKIDYVLKEKGQKAHPGWDFIFSSLQRIFPLKDFARKYIICDIKGII